MTSAERYPKLRVHKLCANLEFLRADAESLNELQYSGPSPSDELAQGLCKGAEVFDNRS